MPSFGEMLRQERKARNIRVRDVAESTKISSIYLRALEANDFAQLPGKVFNKGYVRAYAEFLGVDSGPLIRAYEKEERAQGGGEEIPEATRPAGRGWMARLAVAAVILAVVALGIAAVTFWQGSRSDATPAEAGPAPRQASVIEQAAPEGADSPSEAGGGEAGRGTEAPPPAIPETAPSGADDSGLQAEPASPDSNPEPQASAQAAVIRNPQQPATNRPPRTTGPVSPEGVEPPREAPASALDGGAAAARVSDELPAATGGATAMRVAEQALGGAVENHRLVDEKDQFREGSRVYYWTRVVGAEPGVILRHVWIREGAVVNAVELELGSADWRAHTYKTMFPGSAGDWTVEARDAQDRVLARSTFSCLP